MTVYIEYVLIDNFAIDYMLLKATFLLTGKRTKKGRLLFCAIFGGVFALLYPLMNLNGILLTLLKILFGLLLVFLSAKFENGKNYFINALVFFCLTFSLGGCIIGVFEIFNLDYSAEISVALMFLPAFVMIYIVTAIFRFIYKRKEIETLTYDCELTLEDKKISVRGFIDTGNGLYNGESPVIVCNKSLFLRLVGDRFPKLEKMEISTVAGKSKLIILKLTTLKIFIGQEVNIFSNVTLGVASKSIGNGYEVILHPALKLGGNKNGFKNEEPIKKVS